LSRPIGGSYNAAFSPHSAWVKLGLRPALPGVHGAGGNPASTEIASQLIVAAFGLSVLAAVLAVVGWIGL
jgi:hypothetical protein